MTSAESVRASGEKKANMADSKTAVNLAALYTELNKLGQNEDFGRAIKVAKKSKNKKFILLDLFICLLLLHCCLRRVVLCIHRKTAYSYLSLS